MWNCLFKLEKKGQDENLDTTSVSDPYSLNPDPAKNLNPDPGKFFLTD